MPCPDMAISSFNWVRGEMSAALAKIAKGLARNLRLRLSDSFDNNARFIDESIEPPAGDRIAVSVDHKSDFEKLWGPTL
jgi:hypothetical protein